jgi:hypothetical protein
MAPTSNGAVISTAATAATETAIFIMWESLLGLLQSNGQE